MGPNIDWPTDHSPHRHPLDLTISPLSYVCHCTNQIFFETSWHPLTTHTSLTSTKYQNFYQISNFDQISKFPPNFRILTKFSIFSQISKFRSKCIFARCTRLACLRALQVYYTSTKCSHHCLILSKMEADYIDFVKQDQHCFCYHWAQIPRCSYVSW